LHRRGVCSHVSIHTHACRTLDSMAPNTRAAAAWAFTRVVALLKFWALVVVGGWWRLTGLCVSLFFWQTIECVTKLACRTLNWMAPQPHWATSRATALPEIWTLVAEHSGGLVGAWRLTGVCEAAREGAKVWLRTLPGLVVCGGICGGIGADNGVLRLDLATMRWETMPALVTARYNHACCAVRGTLVVLGGIIGDGRSSSVEMLSSSEEGGAFADLPPLSCGGIYRAAAIAVDESDSAAGQVLLLGGGDGSGPVSTVQLVDLATGACVPQNNLLHRRAYPAAGRLPDGRIVCAGGIGGESSAEVWGAPEQGAPDAAWTWRELPAMIAERHGCCGCVLSDGRFAVLGGESNDFVPMSSCEAPAIDGGDAHWEPLPPMNDARSFFACGTVAGCVIDAGGLDSNLPNCTTWSSIGGCGFRAICLTRMGSKAWAARFCRTTPGNVLAYEYLAHAWMRTCIPAITN
jgi:hypothetical protein